MPIIVGIIIVIVIILILGAFLFARLLGLLGIIISLVCCVCAVLFTMEAGKNNKPLLMIAGIILAVYYGCAMYVMRLLLCMSKVFYKGGVNSQLTRLIPIIIVLITFIASMISLLFGLEEENRKKYIIYSIAPLIINICIIIGITAICELQYRKTDKNLSEYTESVVVERSIYHMIRYVNENEKMFPYTYSKGDNLIVICSLPKDTELKSTGDTIKIEGEEYLEIYYPKINVEGYIPYNVVKEQEEYYSE